MVDAPATTVGNVMSEPLTSARPTPPDDLVELGAWIDGLIADLDGYPDPAVRELVSALLDGIDTLHRAAFSRLVGHLRAPGAEESWAATRRDPVVRATLLLYDLLPRTERERAEEALNAVRPLLEERGASVELRGAVDGVVTARVSRREQGAAMPVTESRQIIARALREHFDGFRELVLEPPPPRLPISVAAPGMPARERPAKRGLPVITAPAALSPPVPIWHDVATLDELAPGKLHGRRVESEAVLLVALEGQVYAYRDACPDTPLALALGALEGDAIVCPWHGCRFDARTGHRLLHRGTALAAFQTTVTGNRVRVAINAPSTPPLAPTTIAVNNRS